MKRNHKLFEDGDKNIPSTIKDDDGNIKTKLCKVCYGAEKYLPTNCPGIPMTFIEMDMVEKGETDF